MRGALANNQTCVYLHEINFNLKADRSYNLEISNPPLPFFVRQAAGVVRGAMNPREEICGKITVKHVYEIAKLKQNDFQFDCMPLEDVCKEVIRTARSIGIEVVHRLDPKDYEAFLAERKVVNDKQLAELEEKRQAKMLRTTG